MRNREVVDLFIQYLPLKLQNIAKKKLNASPTVDEQVIPIETLEKIVNRKHFAEEMTTKSSKDVNYTALQERFPTNNDLSHTIEETHTTINHHNLINFATFVKSGHYISRCLEQKTDKNH